MSQDEMAKEIRIRAMIAGGIAALTTVLVAALGAPLWFVAVPVVCGVGSFVLAGLAYRITWI